MGRLPMIRRAAALLVAAGVGLAVGAAPAWAHESLVGSEPAADGVLVDAPREVRLTFSGNVVDAAPVVVLRDRDSGDAEVAAAEPVVEGPTVTLPIGHRLANGRYAVEWRIVSSDGDPVSGGFSFAVAVPPPVLSTGTTHDVPTPYESPLVAPLPTREPAVETPIGAVADGSSSVGPWLAVAAVLTVVAAALAVRRRGRRTTGSPARRTGGGLSGRR